MNFTKRNHFNPCFWTANWNPSYFANVLSTASRNMRAREQRVYVLNVKSAGIYETTVENVHYDKDLGVAEMTPDDMRDFCKRHHPDRYEQFCRDIATQPESLFLNFEDILTGMENGPAYAALKNVIAKQGIRAPHEKAMIAGFIVVHWLRSHAMMKAMLEWSNELGIKKFEYFIKLKHKLGDPHFLFPLVMTIAPFHWHYYRMRKDCFPLNDSPILINEKNVMLALSPRLMLEIDRTRKQPEASISYSNYIAPETMSEFRRRTISCTFREIIFSSPMLLEEWRDTEEFRNRHKLMKSTTRYNEMVAKDGNKELWNVNALMNR